MSTLIKFFKNNKLGRSLLSVVLAAAVLCSTLSMVTLIPASADNTVWDGKIATTFAGGTGTENDPFKISNGAELAYAITSGGGANNHYVLTNDIYLNETTKVNWETGVADEGYEPNPWYDNNAFQGTIDGDGYVVHGLYYNYTGATGYAVWGTGLIPKVDVGTTASVSNLGVDDSYISGKHGVSAFVGAAGENISTSERANVVIEQCYVGANVTLKGHAVGAFRGASRNSNDTIKNSYSLATLDTATSSGLVAEMWAVTLDIDNCYMVGYDVTDAQWVSGVSNIYSTVVSKYTGEVTVLTDDKMQGPDALTAADKMPNLNVDGVFEATDTYPILSVFNKSADADTDAIDPAKIWDGETLTKPVANEDGVYEISNAAELAYVIDNNGTIDEKTACSFILTDDIYINDPNKVDWKEGTAIGNYEINSWFRYWKMHDEAAGEDIYREFQGTIDGDGHTVYGLYYKDTITGVQQLDAAALIPGVAAGATVTIKNLAVDKAYVNYTNGASAFVGYALSGATVKISNSFAGANVTLIGNDAGVFRAVANNNKDCVLENCYSLATTTGAATYGLIAYNWEATELSFKFKNCYNANGPLNFGGGPGWYCTAENSYSTADNVNADGGDWLNIGSNLITADKMQGPDALTAADKMPNLNSSNAYEATATYPILTVFKVVDPDAIDPAKIWDGKVATSLEGEGTEASPYLISNGAELAYAISNGGAADAHYKLTDNIYLNDPDKVDWTTGEPIGEYKINKWLENNAFQGNIDGDGYVVYGLYFDTGSTDKGWGYWGYGLIPRVNDGTTVTITKLGVDCAYFNAKNATGAFVGFAGPQSYVTGQERAVVNVSECYAGSKVTLNANNAAPFVGGAYGATVTIDNSYSLANSISAELTTEGLASDGFVGNNWSLSLAVNNSYNANGSIYGWWSNSIYEASANNYATGTDFTNSDEAFYATLLTADNMQGLEALVSADKMPNLNADGVYEATATYPVLSVFNKDAEEGGDDDAIVVDPTKVWDGKTLTQPTVVNDDGAYEIGTAAELAYVIVNGGGESYILTDDIYINDPNGVDWTTGNAIGSYKINPWYSEEDFEGTINGDGHVVYGLYYNTADASAWGCEGVGLIPRVNLSKSVEITALGVDYAYVSAKNGASAFVGFAGATSNGADSAEVANTRANVTIDQCYVGANVTLKGNAVGAFRGGTYGSKTTITNSYSLATLVTSGTAGLIGNHWSVEVAIENSYNANGAITSDGWLSAIDSGMKNVYATDKGAYVDKVIGLTADKMQGPDALTAADQMPNLNAGNAYVATDTYPVLKIFTDDSTGEDGDDDEEVPAVEVDERVWDGKTKTAPSEGLGTLKKPYIINTAEELAYVILGGGAANTYYELAADIYLNDIRHIDWTTGEAVAGYAPRVWPENVAFQGTIDGAGHVVYGLYHKNTASAAFGYYGYGLIPRVNLGTSVTVTNLGIENAYVQGVNGASAFVGFAGAKSSSDDTTNKASVSIDQCYVGENVTIIGNDAGAFRGGTRGSTTSITNSYSLATVSGGTHGLIGNIWDGTTTVTNAYNANGGVSSEQWLPYFSLKNVYATDKGAYTSEIVELTTDNMKGEDVFSEGKMQNLNADDLFKAIADGYPTLKVFSGEGPAPVEDEEPGQVWTGVVAKGFDSGSGTEADPYIIDTASELAAAIKNNGYSGAYFKLAADIYLNDITNKLWYLEDTAKVWLESAGFNGHIDGDGHIVYGLYFDKNNAPESAGLITNFANGSIKNLGVKNAMVYAQMYAGGIVGLVHLQGSLTVDSCFVDETVNAYALSVAMDTVAGGIIGYTKTSSNNKPVVTLKITNCYSKANLSGANASHVNGILGEAWRVGYSISDCYSIGYPVYFGYNGGTASSCFWNYNPVEMTDPEFKNEQREGAKLSDFFSDNYSDTGVTNTYTSLKVITDSDSLRGTAAKKSMSGLDYNNVFETVEGGTPKLRIFTQIDGKDIFSSAEADWYGKGIGTQANPFIIDSVEDLRYLVETVDTEGKYYKLACDIYVNNTKNKNWLKNNPVEWYSSPVSLIGFAGTLDGDGHAIYGLYMNEELTKFSEDLEYNSAASTGLFPNVEAAATFRNLHIRDSYIQGAGCVGAFAGAARIEDGRTERLQFIGCSVDESVTLKGYTVGGLVGASHSVGIDLRYCYSTAKMSVSGHENRLSGLVGDCWGAKISALEVYTTEHKVVFGSLVNTTALYAPVEQFGVTVLTKAQMTGSAAKNNMDFAWGDIWYTANGKTPQLKVIPYGEEEELYDEGKVGRVWSGKISTDYAGGDGTKNNPYIIETPEQLARIFALQSSEFTYYKVVADLKLNDTSKDNWEDTAKMWYAGRYFFRGVFDGNGHVVSGLYYKNENNVDNSWAGLFQGIGEGSTIKRIGVTESTLINKGANVHSYAAAICGYLEHCEPEYFSKRVTPVISECFGDDSVYIEATAAAGILAATQSSVIIENCYFTGELTGSLYAAAMVADNWAAAGCGPTLKNCYGATLDGDPLGSGYGTGAFNDDSVTDGRAYLTNCYIAGASLTSHITPISVMFMRGDNAKEYMPKLDYNSVWKTVENGTPVLRCFGSNAYKYASTRDPKTVEISFGNLGDAVVAPMYGFPGYTEISVDDLPIPERRGFIFNGWHHHNPQGCEFELTVFPNYDITLYANWTEVGFTQNFDTELDERYDYNSGIEIFRPGLANYDTKYVHSGWRSIHTLADSSVDPEFLVSYKDTLLVGYEYEITFWMTTDVDGTSGKLYFEQSNWGDVNDEIVGYQEALTFTGLTAGEWKQYTVKIVANAPYLIVRAEKGTSLFFEDFEAIPTGAKGELGDLLGYTPGSVSGEPGTIAGMPIWLFALIIGGAVLVIGGATVVIILVSKKNKKTE